MFKIFVCNLEKKVYNKGKYGDSDHIEVCDVCIFLGHPPDIPKNELKKENSMAADYTKMSLAELKEEAKNRGFKSISAMRKQELIDLLSAEGDKVSVEKKVEVQEEVPQKTVEEPKS